MRIARREFVPLYALLAAIYLFERIFMLEPLLVSSAWIPLLGALALVLPVLLMLRPMLGARDVMDAAFERAFGSIGARAWYACALVLVLMEIKLITLVFAASVMSYTADMVHDRSVVIVTLIVAGLGAYMGELALANCARITLRLLILVMGALALGTLRSARLEHFFPLLGPGPEALTAGLVPLAGVLLTPALMLLRGNTQDPGFRRGLPLGAVLGVLTAAASLAIYTLSQPTLPVTPVTISFRTAILLNNGNSIIQLQLPLIVLWNASQLMLLASLISICGILLRLIAPRIGRLGSPIATAVVVAWCLAMPKEELTAQIVEWGAYPVLALGMALAGIMYRVRCRRTQ